MHGIPRGRRCNDRDSLSMTINILRLALMFLIPCLE
jgi:hypothetical protein